MAFFMKSDNQRDVFVVDNFAISLRQYKKLHQTSVVSNTSVLAVLHITNTCNQQLATS